jgi:hypothetical protein
MGAATGTRFRAAVVLRLSSAPVAETPCYQLIERRFVEARRRTGPMVCFFDVESTDRIIESILSEIQCGMENPHPLGIYTSSLILPLISAC